MKPIIGIAGNETVMVDADSHWISYTPKNFVTGVKRAGGIPLILPIGDLADVPRYIASIDKLLLAGGQDIDPKHYGQLPDQTLGGTNPQRDAFELALVKEAVTQQKPIFGVCRGMQLLNVAFGGTLYQDLSLRPEKALKHVQVPTPFHQPTHPVTIAKDSLLAAVLPTDQDYQVNSFHHQTIAAVAPKLAVIATAPDGVVEGLEHKEQRILGIQWHPELTCGQIETEQQIFEFFVQQL
ncbi:gamma-glutamyl-gamma-aminobutyrate hydrolase family protein [Enterococcus sp. AD013-P3]|uniref:gamma-glutamyl-gamma-aminobutyrate hydrolase family protein n=1 Tax=Enterococcus sp. AD013-P3 TaxID=3411036 RepID=UPI003B95FA85